MCGVARCSVRCSAVSIGWCMQGCGFTCWCAVLCALCCGAGCLQPAYKARYQHCHAPVRGQVLFAVLHGCCCRLFGHDESRGCAAAGLSVCCSQGMHIFMEVCQSSCKGVHAYVAHASVCWMAGLRGVRCWSFVSTSGCNLLDCWLVSMMDDGLS
jgi:hypothetical protein